MAGDREAFLRRVRDAAARGRSFPVRTVSDFPANVGYVGGGPDVVERLAAEFEAVGGHAHRAASDDDARAILRHILSEARATLDGQRAAVTGGTQGATAGLSSSTFETSRDRHQRTSPAPRPASAPVLPCCLLWKHPLLDRLAVGGVVEQSGFAVLSWDDLKTNESGPEKERLFAAAVGVSSVDWAVAETGTLAVAARPGQPRSVSLLPPVHITILERDQILSDLFDLFERLLPAKGGQAATATDLPSNLVLITGPSKTGDIELRLTTGVHGPGEVHAVILDPR